MPRLLALDVSSAVGFAVMTRGSPPYLGTLYLSGDIARKHFDFLDWLDSLHSLDAFDAVAFERPIITPTDTVKLLELLYGLIGVVYAFAGKHDLPWREVDVPTAKLALTGKAKATKDEMLHAARRMGWDARTDHEADAGAVGVVAYEMFWPKPKVAA